MSQFKDTYGILALAAITKKITQKEDNDKMSKFFSELEKILYTINNQLVEKEQCTKHY